MTFLMVKFYSLNLWNKALSILKLIKYLIIVKLPDEGNLRTKLKRF